MVWPMPVLAPVMSMTDMVWLSPLFRGCGLGRGLALPVLEIDTVFAGDAAAHAFSHALVLGAQGCVLFFQLDYLAPLLSQSPLRIQQAA